MSTRHIYLLFSLTDEMDNWNDHFYDIDFMSQSSKRIECLIICLRIQTLYWVQVCQTWNNEIHRLQTISTDHSRAHGDWQESSCFPDFWFLLRMAFSEGVRFVALRTSKSGTKNCRVCYESSILLQEKEATVCHVFVHCRIFERQVVWHWIH